MIRSSIAGSPADTLRHLARPYKGMTILHRAVYGAGLLSLVQFFSATAAGQIYAHQINIRPHNYSNRVRLRYIGKRAAADTRFCT